MFGGKLKSNAAQRIGAEGEIRAIGRVRAGTQNHALVVTDSNVHQFRLAWPGISKITEEVASYPVDGLQLEIDKWHVRLLRDSAELAAFSVVQNNYPSELHQWFEARGALVEPD